MLKYNVEFTSVDRYYTVLKAMEYLKELDYWNTKVVSTKGYLLKDSYLTFIDKTNNTVTDVFFNRELD